MPTSNADTSADALPPRQAVSADALLKRTLRFALLPPLVAIALLMYLLVQQLQETRRAADEVDRTDRIIAQADKALRLLVDMETGQRGFLIGGAPKFLKPYYSAQEQISPTLDTLDDLLLTSQARQDITQIRQAQAQWQVEAERQIRQRRARTPNLVAEFNRGDVKSRMDAIRGQFERFIIRQQELRDTRQGTAEAATRQLLTVGGGAALLIGGLLAALSVNQLRTLSRHYHRLVQDEQQTREYMTTTLESIGDATLVTSNEGRITLMNAIAEQITGWKASDAIGKDHRVLFDIYHEETGDPVPSPVDTVLHDGKTVYLANHTVLRRRDGTTVPIEDSAAPIKNALGNLIGVVLVFRDVSERKAREAEIERLVEKDRRIAETLQRSLLLTPPDNAFSGLTFSTRYEAAWNEAQVGGDFHDAFALQGGKVAFVVGDVTGKGLEAAAYTGEIKFVLRAYLRENPDPANALARLNAFLVEAERLGDRIALAEGEIASSSATMGSSKMAGVAVAVIDSSTGEVLCAGAGAEAPVVALAQGEAQELPVSGPIAGMEAGSCYEAHRLHLLPGDLLIFTTDGITEARNRRIGFFGPEGLMEAVQEARPTPDVAITRLLLNDLSQHIVARARDFAGGKLRDDLCIVIVSRATSDEW